MGLPHEISCETGSFPCLHNPHKFLSPEDLRLYFPMLEPWVMWSVLLPSCSSRFIFTQMWDCLVRQLPPCCASSPPQLPISTPPTGLDESFFFNSPVVGLPYSSIVWHIWLFLFFNLLLSFFWLCEKAKCIYLHLHLGRKSWCHL